MKVAVLSAAIWVAIVPMAIAQTGGYPASPSHGVMGPPNPDGSLHYGTEPTNDLNPSPNTVGRSGPNLPDGRSGAPGENAAKDGDRAPERAGSAAGR